MPPKIKITKDNILNTGVELLRQEGREAINARDLAKRLGCSVQPIFRAFESMEALKDSIYKRVEEVYNTKMLNALQSENGGFLEMGLTYIEFAKTEPNFFKLLFMSDIFHQKSTENIAGSTMGDDETIEEICVMTGLSQKKAQKLYTGIWFTTHGIASLLATNSCEYSKKETRKMLIHVFQGLVYSIKKEEEE
ncbi:MAG: TetR/AcrR family transcriptional regulator [Velocimicrobium sp.]